MSFITVNNSYFLRWISILGLIFYLISLYNIIFKLTRNQLGAFCISLVLSTIIPIINVVSYGSMFIYSWSFVFALISVQYYMEAIKGLGNKNYKHLIKGLVATSILIICSNLIYQATSTVAFLGLTLYIIFNKEKLDYIGRYKNYIYYIGYIVIFISSTGIYYIGYRLTMRYFQIYLMQRGDIIFSIKELIEKIQWFIGIVFIENIKQLISSVLGTGLFLEKWQHYTLSFTNKDIGILLIIFIFLTIFYGCIKVVKKSGSGINGLLLIVCMGLSYYVFIILKENSYTSYYSVGLCSILLVVCIYSFYSLTKKFFRIDIRNKIYKVVPVLICFYMLINANTYIRDFWVGYNEYGYTYLKNQILDTNPTERIHLYGSLYPGQADVYTINATRMAFKELGINGDEITITTSSNKEFIEVLSIETYNTIVPYLVEEEIKTLNELYILNENFGLYTIDYAKLDKDNRDKLKAIFEKSGILPNETIPTINLNNVYRF